MTNAYRTAPSQDFKAEKEAERAGIKAWVPDHYVHRRAGKSRRIVGEVRRPLCGGYIFADRRPENSQYITRNVGAVAECDLTSLRDQSGKRQEPDKPKVDPDPIWTKGDTVTIASGPLEGVDAVVDEVRGKIAFVEGHAWGAVRRIALHIRQLKRRAVA